ncbi:hypothetical protein [Massilia sp. PWRC2]|uniref:hypothetical protein n=1 Tax=Massilia sp. PWRC2 TaxID=2804626 RepID=UPI003CF3C2E4
MALDLSMYNALLQRPKSVADYDAEAMTNQSNALANQTNALGLQQGRMKMDEYQRSVTDGNKLRQVVAGFGEDQTANYNSLLRAGRLDEAQKYQKGNAESLAKTADIGKTKEETAKMQKESAAHQFEIAGQLASAWATNPGVTKAQIQAGLAAASHSGVISPEITQAKMTELESMADNPQALNGWAKGTLQQVMKAKDSMSYIAPDANNVANNDRIKADKAAERAVQMRGQNISADTAGKRLAFDKEQATAENAPDTTTQKEKELWLHTYTANNGQMPRSAPPSVRKYIGTWAAEMGITPADLSSGAAKAKFDQAMAVTAGHRGGAMASVEATMPALVENAQDLSHKLGQGKFVPLNKLAQMSNDSISDPTLAAFKVAHMAVVSEYQQVISRGGTNVTALNEAMHVLNGARSVEAYDAAMNMVKKEVAINVAGAKAVRAGVGSDNHGAAPAAVPPKAPAGFDPAAIAAELKKRGH